MMNLFNGTLPSKIPQLKVVGIRGDNSIVSLPKVDLEQKPTEWNGSVAQRDQRGTLGQALRIQKMNVNVSKKLE